MNIIINGLNAVIKKDSSFDYITENRFFTDADDFSLTISFPLAGCKQNIRIFGHLNRKDVDNPKSVLSCSILDNNISINGVIAITEFNETEVKGQFLGGRSISNYSISLDEIYINELPLGIPANGLFNELNESVNSVWGLDSKSWNYGKFIAIPWINNTTGIFQNEVARGMKENSYVMYDREPLSYMPYMLYLTKAICKAINYDYDFSLWENSDLKYLLCCNAIPTGWAISNYEDALPHWSVKEFFTQLEYLIGCEFEINTIDNKINFVWPAHSADLAGDYLIQNPIDEFSVNVESVLRPSEKEKPQLFRFSDSCPEDNKCDWLIEKYHNNVVEINSWEQWDKELLSVFGDGGLVKFKSEFSQDLLKYNPTDKIFHFLDTYFIVETAKFDHTEVIDGVSYDFFEQHLKPIAMFAPFLNEQDEDNAKVINFVPVSFRETVYWFGDEIILDCGEYSADESLTEQNKDAEKSLGRYAYALEKGEQKEKTEYFSTIFVAMAYPMQVNYGLIVCQYRPFIDSIYIDQLNWQLQFLSRDYEYSDIFRLKQNRVFNSKTRFKDIDVTTEYNFKWIANEIPNIRSIFFINGKKYVAKKITATFTDKGMSQLLKGVFYKVTD